MDKRYLKNDFDLEETSRFDESFSKFRSIGHWILTSIVLAGLIGVFGFGVWTNRTVPWSLGICFFAILMLLVLISYTIYGLSSGLAGNGH
jgi:hypothetical protein